MDLTKQVVSLELAKRLKELNCKQESYFVWELFDICPPKLQTATAIRTEHADYYSAFTVAELGEMLPVATASNKLIDNTFFCHILNTQLTIKDENLRQSASQYANTEANARCHMLIYLIENELLNKKV